MKINTTYEMDDIVGLITRDLVAKGLVPDPTSFNFRVKIMRDDQSFVNDVPVVEIDVRVSGAEPADRVEHVEHAAAPPISGPLPEESRDLLAEAPQPGLTPAVDIGSLAATSRAIEQSNPGLFAPERVTRRTMMDGESSEYPGAPRTGGR